MRVAAKCGSRGPGVIPGRYLRLYPDQRAVCSWDNSDPGVLVLYQGGMGGSILSGEPSVPGIIPGGMASGLIPGRGGSTLSKESTVPGKILAGIASRFTPARQLSRAESSTF